MPGGFFFREDDNDDDSASSRSCSSAWRASGLLEMCDCQHEPNRAVVDVDLVVATVLPWLVLNILLLECLDLPWCGRVQVVWLASSFCGGQESAGE
jgi:hypothetical protein